MITLYRLPECPSNLFISPLEKIRSKSDAMRTRLPYIFTGDFSFLTIGWKSESVIGGGVEYRLQAESLRHFTGKNSSIYLHEKKTF